MERKLTNYITAGYPAVAIRTIEEPRAMELILRVAKQKERNLFTWDACRGFEQYREANNFTLNVNAEDCQTPGDAAKTFLAAVTSTDEDAEDREAPGILVFLDLHTWIDNLDPTSERAIKDLVSRASKVGLFVIFLGYNFSIPASFARYVTISDFDLPDRDELNNLLTLVEASATGGGVKLDALANGEREEVLRAATGLSAPEAENAFALAVIEAAKEDPTEPRTIEASTVYREKASAVRRSGLMEIIEPDPRGLDAIGGLDNLKHWIKTRKHCYTRKAKAYGLPSPRGVLAVGVPGCLHPDTPIYDPVDRSTKTVKERADEGCCFHVYALSGNQPIIAEAWPPLAYRKAEMVKLTLDTGEQITVTKGHRIWNGVSWVEASLVCESLSQFGAYPLPTISGSGLEALRVGDRRYCETAASSGVGYPACRHFCGAQPLFSLGDDRASSPSQADVRGRNREHRNQDDRASKSSDKRGGFSSVQSSPRPARSSFSNLRGSTSAGGEVHQEPSRLDTPCPNWSPGASQLDPGSSLIHRDASPQVGARQSKAASCCASSALIKPSLPIGVSGTGRIIKAEDASTEVYYDFHVPTHENYWACGMWHHNTGKSLAAKCIGTTLNVPTLRLDLGNMLASLVGESEARMRDALALADAIAPCVVWVDEIEKGLAGSAASGALDSGVGKRILGTLLTWQQEHKADVFVFATANQVHQLPPELLRKGRFDEIFYLDLPVATERQEIAAIHLEKVGRKAKDFDLKKIARATEKYTGSEIEECIRSALFDAYYDKARKVTTADIVAAAKATTPLSRTMAEQIEAIRDFGEKRCRPASAGTKDKGEQFRRAMGN